MEPTGGTPAAARTPAARGAADGSADARQPRSGSRSRPTFSDRFIPSRGGSELSAYGLPVGKESGDVRFGTEREDTSQAYVSMLRSSLLDSPGNGPLSPPPQPHGAAGSPGRAAALRRTRSTGAPPSVRNLLHFMDAQAGAGPKLPSVFSAPLIDGADAAGASARKPTRKIARSPFKVLDAPQLADDFYMNLVDWSSGGGGGSAGVLAVGLNNTMYLWNANNSQVTRLLELPAAAAADDAADGAAAVPNVVTGVSWSNRGSYLAVGTNPGMVEVWDAEAQRCVRRLEGHRQRVCALAWCGTVLSSGGRDRMILQHDMRSPGDAIVSRLASHRSEVCGLRWSPDRRELASGGNDNLVLIWSARGGAGPVHRFEAHRAAIKALAWSPHTSGLLASGGGTADKCIRLWNTVTGAELQCTETGSQVCNLAWSSNVDELVSTHGYSQNQVVLWRHPDMTKLATLTGHTMRVLYLAVSPDGQTIVTGAGDETLRFWSLFPGQTTLAVNSNTSQLSLGRSHIR